MTYNEFIQNIIDTRGQWTDPGDGIWENHHIIPRCKGGLPKRWTHTTKHTNLIWLTLEEHYEAHKLLFEENPDNEALQLAWWRTAYDKNGNFISPMYYAELKQHNLIFSDTHKANISKNHTDVSGKNNPMYGKGYLLEGEKNGRFGIETSTETKKKISETRKKQTELNKAAGINLLIWRKNNPEAFSVAQSKAGSKPVICIEYNLRFNNIKSAKAWLKENNLPGAKYISDCCKGKREDACGLHWEYIRKNRGG